MAARPSMVVRSIMDDSAPRAKLLWAEVLAACRGRIRANGGHDKHESVRKPETSLTVYRDVSKHKKLVYVLAARMPIKYAMDDPGFSHRDNKERD